MKGAKGNERSMIEARNLQSDCCGFNLHSVNREEMNGKEEWPSRGALEKKLKGSAEATRDPPASRARNLD
eukprot:2292467-Pleurochrysis_carterae.AAC.1